MVSVRKHGHLMITMAERMKKREESENEREIHGYQRTSM
ncbi:hypothetical protein EYF80_066204 [Liparis tanakae]|uniref:Uncharacterized protein n=1 Tax=Liparis tanakae TaxID=230148 RepID=A0A4Z2E4Y4_9TELE|nr:hypothetical protein EYF80_066204 [Liparis tanakae]